MPLNEWAHCCVKCSHKVARKIVFFLRVLSSDWLHCFLMKKQHFGSFHFPNNKFFLWLKKTISHLLSLIPSWAQICAMEMWFFPFLEYWWIFLIFLLFWKATVLTTGLGHWLPLYWILRFPKSTHEFHPNTCVAPRHPAIPTLVVKPLSVFQTRLTLCRFNFPPLLPAATNSGLSSAAFRLCCRPSLGSPYIKRITKCNQTPTGCACRIWARAAGEWAFWPRKQQQQQQLFSNFCLPGLFLLASLCLPATPRHYL